MMCQYLDESDEVVIFDMYSSSLMWTRWERDGGKRGSIKFSAWMSAGTGFDA